MASQDITNIVERLEAFEDRLGVRIESLAAEFIQDEYQTSVVVRGELHSKAGQRLQGNMEVVVAAYDSSSRVVGTGSAGYIDAEKFFGFEVFEVHIDVRVKRLTRVRVYPKQV